MVGYTWSSCYMLTVLPALPQGHTIKDMDKCDFRPIYDHLIAQREAEKERKKNDPAYKQEVKEEKARLQDIYGFAIVDGYREKVGNFRVEPPSLFRGRGQHPKTGMVKVSLNLMWVNRGGG